MGNTSIGYLCLYAMPNVALEGGAAGEGDVGMNVI